MLNSTRSHSNLFFILCLSVLAQSISAESINYFKGNLHNAREKAQAEGKLLFVDFYASWCAPCKWMEQNTFTDPEVIKLLNQKFIPVKVNIDDFEGYNMKEQFEVKVLPTLLFFNTEGKVVTRIEETLSPSKMREILNKNMKVIAPVERPINSSPQAIAYKSKSPIDKTFEPTVHEKSFKLQLGLFTNYENTLQFYNQIVGIIEDPVNIMHDYKGEQVVYRVLLGNFKDVKEAHVYRTQLKEKLKIESFVFL